MALDQWQPAKEYCVQPRTGHVMHTLYLSYSISIHSPSIAYIQYITLLLRQTAAPQQAAARLEMTTCTNLLDAWQQVAPYECCSNSIQVCFIGINVTTMYCGNYVLSPMCWLCCAVNHVLVAKARNFSGQLGRSQIEKPPQKKNKKKTLDG